MSESRPRRSLTIGIDARAAAEVPAGRGRVVRELLRELARRDDPHRYLLYARRRWQEQELDERFAWRLQGEPEGLWHLRAARAATGACEVFLSTNSYLTGWFLGVPDVVFVYDLVAFDPALTPRRRSAVIERATTGLSVRRAAALICISQATADALVARFPRAQGRVQVAPLGAAAPLERPAPADELLAVPPEGFVLAVGTLEPRKNLPRLVQAYARLAPELQQRHPLVVVGAAGWETGPTLSAVRSLGERARLLGHVSDAALGELYRRCAVFCYPSLGEGFGLPVLEAMAAGAAVLTAGLSSLPEVGGDAVAYCDPRRVHDIATALEALLSDPGRRQELALRARERAKLFSWQRFAGSVLAALERAAPPPRFG